MNWFVVLNKGEKKTKSRENRRIKMNKQNGDGLGLGGECW